MTEAMVGGVGGPRVPSVMAGFDPAIHAYACSQSENMR